MGRVTALANWRINSADILIQMFTSVFPKVTILSGVFELRLSQLHSAFQFIKEGPLIGIVAVQFQTGISDVNTVQAPFHDLKGGHLLSHEQNLLTVRDSFGD